MIATPTLHAPEFQPPHEWLNSPPLRMAQLRGHVVLVDIWDFTCINCLRTLPYVREWHRRYSPKGLTVVGVHAPEFRFARERRQVTAAIHRLGVEWPVLLDNEYRNWQAYANRYWPTKYLVDKRGYIRYLRSGEGGYGETETAIQTLLRERDPGVELPRPLDPLRDEDRPGAVCYRTTPELHAGLDRGALGNPEGYAVVPVLYRLPPAPARQDGSFYADGTWLAGQDHFSFVGQSGVLVLPYRAASINAVMAPSADPVDLLLDLKRPATVEVTIDGQPIAREEMGEDARQEAGATVLSIDSPRLYSIAVHPDVRPRELQMRIASSGLSLFSFTFTSCVSR